MLIIGFQHCKAYVKQMRRKLNSEVLQASASQQGCVLKYHKADVDAKPFLAELQLI